MSSELTSDEKYRPDVDHLFLEKISGAVIFNDDPNFLGKHGDLYRQAKTWEATVSHSMNGCHLTEGHMHYGKTQCHFCGKTIFAYSAPVSSEVETKQSDEVEKSTEPSNLLKNAQSTFDRW